MSNTIFLPLTKEYYNDVKRLICNTWQFNKYVLEKHLNTFVDAVFYAYLSECNYSQIAITDNKITGVMLAHIAPGRCNVNYLFLAMCRIIRLSLDSGGRKCLAILKNISACESELQKGRKSSSNKLLLLAVDKNMRNRGIGSALLNDMHKRCKSFYLTTDTLCNYSFYDKKGFIRIGEKQFTFFSGFENMFLYEYNGK